MKQLFFIAAILILITNQIEAANKYKERDFFKAKLEPEMGVLHGAGQGEENTTFLEYSEVVGKSKPVVYMAYVSLSKTVDELYKKGKYIYDRIFIK